MKKGLLMAVVLSGMVVHSGFASSGDVGVVGVNGDTGSGCQVIGERVSFEKSVQARVYGVDGAVSKDDFHVGGVVLFEYKSIQGVRFSKERYAALFGSKVFDLTSQIDSKKLGDQRSMFLNVGEHAPISWKNWDGNDFKNVALQVSFPVTVAGDEVPLKIYFDITKGSSSERLGDGEFVSEIKEYMVKEVVVSGDDVLVLAFGDFYVVIAPKVE